MCIQTSVHACVFVVALESETGVEMAYLSLPLSPGQRSSSLARVSAGSSFLQLPSSSSDLAQCAGTALKHPVTEKERTYREQYWN